MRHQSALALGAFLLSTVAALKRPHLGSLSRRGQDRARSLVQDATHEKLIARQANYTSSSNKGSRFLSSATESR